MLAESLKEPMTSLDGVQLVSMTPDPETTMAYLARVSNPANQLSGDTARLLRYCIRHQHWSVFEHAHLTMEIRAPRAITAQILRHRSFTFQEFSQRYAQVDTVPAVPQLRRQDTKNRQNSTDDLPDDLWFKYENRIQTLFDDCYALYRDMLADGIAKECARFVLPVAAPSRIYVTGNVRSWIHYIQLRSANGTQREHRDVALKCKDIFKEKLPIIAAALGWDE